MHINGVQSKLHPVGCDSRLAQIYIATPLARTHTSFKVHSLPTVKANLA